MVIGSLENAFVWSHRGLMEPLNKVLKNDGVHLNTNGQYKLYRSYRGAMLKALNMINEMDCQ